MANLELKALIIRRFGTQVDFSRIVGLREDRISKLIHGRAKATGEECTVIAKKLGVTVQELFPGAAKERCAGGRRFRCLAMRSF